MSDRGLSQNFQNVNVLHFWGALPKEAHFSKGVGLKSFQYEMRAYFIEKSLTGVFIQHSNLWEQWNTHNHA